MEKNDISFDTVSMRERMALDQRKGVALPNDSQQRQYCMNKEVDTYLMTISKASFIPGTYLPVTWG
jgi:hypothetical protein